MRIELMNKLYIAISWSLCFNRKSMWQVHIAIQTFNRKCFYRQCWVKSFDFWLHFCIIRTVTCLSFFRLIFGLIAKVALILERKKEIYGTLIPFGDLLLLWNVYHPFSMSLSVCVCIFFVIFNWRVKKSFAIMS